MTPPNLTPPKNQSLLSRNGIWIGLIVFLGLIPFIPFLLSGNILYASDQVGSPAWKFYFESIRSFTIPLWNPYNLGGMPTFDAMWGDASYPFFLLMGAIFPVEKAVSYNFVLHVLIAGFTAFFLARRFFSLSKPLSLVIAVAYMLNTNYISHIYSGHTGKFHIMSWLPLSLYFLLKALSPAARWYHLLGLSLTVALFIFTSHLQFTYFVLMGYFLYWCYSAFQPLREKAFKHFLLLAGKFWIPVLLGIGLAFPIFYPPIKYNQEFSVRGTGEKQTFEHATSWSLHPEELASLVVPEFTGLQEKYWGRNFFKLNSEYPGLSILFLAIFGLAAFRTRWHWFWFSILILGSIYTLGAHTPFFQLFYHLIPGIKSFRAPSQMTFWIVTALALMSAQTLRILSSEVASMAPEKRQRLGKKLLQIGLGAAGFLFLAGLASGSTYGLWNSLVNTESIPNFAKQAGNHAEFQKGAVRAAVFLVLLVFATWKWAISSAHMTRFALALIVLTFGDLYLINRNFIQAYEFSRMFGREPAIEQLKTETTPFRVFGVPGTYNPGFMQYHKIQTVDGFVDNEYKVFRAFRGGDYQSNPNFFKGLKQNPDGTISGSPFLNLLNVKYIAFRVPEDPGIKLAPNKDALPRAWFVRDWETVEDDRIMDKLASPEFQPREKALVSSTTPLEAKPATRTVEAIGTAALEDSATDSATTVAIEATGAVEPAEPLIERKEWGPNRLAYAVKNSQAGILVLSELYFPHWKVKVDGREGQVLRVDYALRGVHLSEGNHEVVFEYQSPWIRKGLLVSLICAILLSLSVFGYKIVYRPENKA